MKKSLIIVLLALLVVGVCVSCQPEVDEKLMGGGCGILLYTDEKSLDILDLYQEFNRAARPKMMYDYALLKHVNKTVSKNNPI